MFHNVIFSVTIVAVLFSRGQLSAQDQTPTDDSLNLKTWPQLYIADIDGKNLKRLFPESTGRAEGAVSFSENGHLMIFSGYNAAEKERITSSVIYVVDLETGQEQELCKGINPSLSPRGKRFFYYRYDDRGVWVSDIEDPENTATKLDARGGGTAWSPDGKLLAWATYSNSYNLKIFDIVEGDDWIVFAGEKSPFRIIYNNFAWSPDSRNIVFKGVTHERQTGIYAAQVIDEREPVLLREAARVHHALDWHPDGSKILFSELDPDSRLYRLKTLEPLKTDSEPVAVPGIPAQILATNPHYTPDGQQIIFSAAIKPAEKKEKEEEQAGKAE